MYAVSFFIVSKDFTPAALFIAGELPSPKNSPPLPKYIFTNSSAKFQPDLYAAPNG